MIIQLCPPFTRIARNGSRENEYRILGSGNTGPQKPTTRAIPTPMDNECVSRKNLLRGSFKSIQRPDLYNGCSPKTSFFIFFTNLLHCSLNGTVKKIRSSIQRKSKRNFIFILVWASLQFRVFKSDSLIRNIILYRGKGTRGILRKIRIDYLISHCKILRFIMMDRQVSRWSVRRNCSLSAGKTRW